MKLEKNIKLNMKSKNLILKKNKKSLFSKLIPTSLILLNLFGCSVPVSDYASEEKNTTNDEITSVVSSAMPSNDEPITKNTYLSEMQNENELRSFLEKRINFWGEEALFCDIDLDGNTELLLSDIDEKSFSSYCYTIYKLYGEIPEYYGTLSLENGTSEHIAGHTICEGSLKRYYDPAGSVFAAIGDDTLNYGNVTYRVWQYTFYSDNMIVSPITLFNGVYCCSAEKIRNTEDRLWTGEYNYVFDYNYGLFDLNGTDKFADVSEAVSSLEFVDEIDLQSLDRYSDIDGIVDKIKKYSGYGSNDTALSAGDDSGFLDILDQEYVIDSEEAYANAAGSSDLKCIALLTDNFDTDHFKFLYDNTNIEFIRFDKSVTDEQIKQIVCNMPNLKAVAFGFSEV